MVVETGSVDPITAAKRLLAGIARDVARAATKRTGVSWKQVAMHAAAAAAEAARQLEGVAPAATTAAATLTPAEAMELAIATIRARCADNWTGLDAALAVDADRTDLDAHLEAVVRSEQALRLLLAARAALTGGTYAE